MSKKELEEQIENVKTEIGELETLTNIGNMEGFELIIKKIKEDIIQNVKEEDWKSLKQNKSKIEKMRGFTDYIEKQTQIIEDKEAELTDLTCQLNNYQTSLFEDVEEKKSTEFVHNGKELFTGDIFQNSDKKLLLIYESSESEGKFAIIKHLEDGELLLNYPKNREVLDSTDFLGNLFDDEKLQKLLETELEKQDEL